MPLIDLKTDLKSLRFGNDRKGGGNSGQPYIKTGIPETPFEEAIASPLGVKDFLLRGGLNAVTDTAEDVLRLGKMFLNPKNPSGLLFAAKQNLLSRTAVRTQTSGILNEGIYTPLSTLSQAGVNAFGGHLNKQGVNPFEQTGAYSNNNNLYGVRVKPTQLPGNNRLVILKTLVDEGNSRTLSDGEIFNEGGDIKVNVLSYGGGPGSDLGIGRTNIRYADQRTGDQNALASSKPGYFYGTPGKQGFREFKPDNYLVSLSQNYLNFTDVGGTIGSLPVVNPLFKANTASKLYEKQTLTQVNVNSFSPDGKPLYTTDVYIDKDISKTNKDLAFKSKDGNAALTQQQVLTQILSRNSGIQVQDFRKEITADSIGTEAYNTARKNGTLTDAPDYSGPNAKNYEQRVNAGDPGKRGLIRTNYSKGALDPATNKPYVVNEINAMYMYVADSVTNSKKKNDFVKLRFAVINPDQPSQKTFVHFPAFFDGAITDNMSAGWDSFKYLGRAEEFYNYTGFNREISFSFTVVAQSKPELSLMYQKLNYLQSSLTPNYNITDGFMRGNIHQLTLGGYFYEQPGVLTTLNYTMPQDSPWEIGIPADSADGEAVGGISYRDPSVKELTHMIQVQVSFKPIHTFLPQIVGSALDRIKNIDGVFGGGNIDQRYIALTNDGDGNKNNLYSKGTPNRTYIPEYGNKLGLGSLEPSSDTAEE
jgi:hypothetical protein